MGADDTTTPSAGGLGPSALARPTPSTTTSGGVSGTHPPRATLPLHVAPTAAKDFNAFR